MDFKDIIKQLVERILKLKDNLQTEEATKTALIMPFLQALGYDVFDPTEVCPEYVCDIGTKKGEKIDYAIMRDGETALLIECKKYHADLNLHDNQLLRYFNVSKAKFGILTDGITYKFYTDLEKENVMDNRPFLEVNLLDIKDGQIDEIRKFHKSYFDVSNIVNTAGELKYTTELKRILNEEFNSPSPDLVKYFAKQVYEGAITAKVFCQFETLLKGAMLQWKNEIINDRIKVALGSVQQSQEMKDQPAGDEQTETKAPDDVVVTTQDELDAYNIVRSILRKDVEVSRIYFTDFKTYSVVGVDKPSKWICRFYFGRKLSIAFPLIEEGKGEERFDLQAIEDIFGHSEKLTEILIARL